MAGPRRGITRPRLSKRRLVQSLGDLVDKHPNLGFRAVKQTPSLKWVISVQGTLPASKAKAIKNMPRFNALGDAVRHVDSILSR